MKYYKTKKGFIKVSNFHSKYFERNNNFVKSIELTVPNFLTIKTNKPYEIISENKMKEHIKQIIKEHQTQVKRHKKLLKELFN